MNETDFAGYLATDNFMLSEELARGYERIINSIDPVYYIHFSLHRRTLKIAAGDRDCFITDLERYIPKHSVFRATFIRDKKTRLWHTKSITLLGNQNG